MTQQTSEPTFDRRSVAEIAPTLTDQERYLLRAAINAMPGGQRPVADEQTLGGFVAGYARKALQAALDNATLTDAGTALARAALAKLEPTETLLESEGAR